jgi:hypothetical protein
MDLGRLLGRRRAARHGVDVEIGSQLVHDEGLVVRSERSRGRARA